MSGHKCCASIHHVSIILVGLGVWASNLSLSFHTTCSPSARPYAFPAGWFARISESGALGGEGDRFAGKGNSGVRRVDEKTSRVDTGPAQQSLNSTDATSTWPHHYLRVGCSIISRQDVSECQRLKPGEARPCEVLI